ncbi:MAG TPA: glycosyltransferase [Candidatus Deferrimicrobiaceae bacterium]
MTGHLVVSYHTCPMEEPGTGLSGGMNVFLRGLLRGFSRRGIPTDVLTRAAGNDAEISSPFPGVRIVHVPCGWKSPPTRRSAFESLDGFIDGSPRWMREHRIAPRVVSAHYWMSGVAARRLTDAPMVLVYHTVEARKPGAGAGDADSLSEVRRREEERLAPEAARVVCFSEHDLAETGKAIPAVTAKGVVIPPGVDDRFRRLPPRQVARAYVGLPTGADILLVAARGDEGKNTAAAVDAFRRIRERWDRTLILVVAGQGGPEGGGVTFLPSVPHDGMPMLYAAADAVICPSRYESFGMVPLEALASGVPVAVPRGTYWGGKVGSEGGGVAYDPDDPGGLTGAMLSLLSDPVLRSRLSREAVRVASPFTWETCTESWERLLSSVSTPRNPR